MSKKGIGYGLISLLASIGILATIGWALDDDSSSVVGPHVELAGKSIGGLTQDELAAAINQLDVTYAAASMRIGTEDDFSIKGTDIDLHVDKEATFHRAMRAGRNGNVASDIFNWVRGIFRAVPVDVQVTFDKAKLQRLVEENDSSGRRKAVEPGFKVENNRLVAIEGSEGRGIEVNDVADEIGRAVDKGIPLEIAATTKTVPPRYALRDAELLGVLAEQSVVRPIALRSESVAKDVPADMVRTWLTTTPGPTTLQIAIDNERASKDLEQLFPETTVQPVEPRWNVVDHVPTVIPGQDGTICCAASTLAAIADEVTRRTTGPVGTTPILTEQKPFPPRKSLESFQQDKIIESIGTFTTYHAAGQPRVTNIHLIADLVRGQTIQPEETFSLNGFVGPRTVEKGFAVDHVIENGKFAEAVGGGISQFATTLFNAAFFGGLDYGKYQSHSIYISRYPYGREATISFPNPDLQIRNSSPHPVMIWTSYTNTSITVELFSTRYATGAQTGQKQQPSGKCTLVKTERTRTYVDGRTEQDEVRALYQPAEGQMC